MNPWCGELVSTSLWAGAYAHWPDGAAPKSETPKGGAASQGEARDRLPQGGSPEFGSMVAIDDEDYISLAIVYHIAIEKTDQNRSVHMFKQPLAQLRVQQPQIFLFSYVRAELLLIGHVRTHTGEYLQNAYVPPLHASVRAATEPEKEACLGSLWWLEVLLARLPDDTFVQNEIIMRWLHWIEHSHVPSSVLDACVGHYINARRQDITALRRLLT